MKPKDRGMEEKYYHSMGARLHEEGRLGEAVNFFRKAILTENRSYTRFLLAMTLKAKGDHLDALRELTRAIGLNPSFPEYYYERSLLWLTTGEKDNAARDLEEACRLDPNYSRIDKIRSALDKTAKTLHMTPITLDGSCPVSTCPVYCCHFSGEMILHGVTIGSGKLHTIRSFIVEKGLSEDRYIRKLPFSGEEHLSRLIPPHHILKDRRQRSIFYPARGEKPIGKDLLRDLPKGIWYNSIAWIDENARPCAFLSQGKCDIYHVGEETSLEPCRQFLCLTGYIFLILKGLGLFDEKQIAGKGMGEINNLAVEILIHPSGPFLKPRF